MRAFRRDEGYAVIAAMLAAAGFALVAVQLIATSRGAVASASAEAARARMTADAQAGLALALDGLTSPDPQGRWTLGGEARSLDFDDAELTIHVEDERGKIPLNTISPDQVRTMFRLAGADPATVEALAQAYLLRRDPHFEAEDDDARKVAVTTPAPRSTAPATPPSAAGDPGALGFADTRELLLLPGMTADMYAALAPSVTVNVHDAAFEPRTATPLALEVMEKGGGGAVAGIERQRELAGERTALDTAPPLTLAGRPLTVRVDVHDRRGGGFERATVVELTRSASHPYVLRMLSADGGVASAGVMPASGSSG